MQRLRLLCLLALPASLFACRASEPEATEPPRPLSIVDAISTIGPPIREVVEEAESRGDITASDSELIYISAGSLQQYVGGRVVETGDGVITIETFLRKEGDAYFVQGEERRFIVPPRAPVERTIENPISLADLRPNEFVVVWSRDGQTADRVTGMGIDAP
jgi:hypothetical protein